MLLYGSGVRPCGLDRRLLSLLDTASQNVRQPTVHGSRGRLRTTSKEMGKASWFRTDARLSLRTHPFFACRTVAALLIARPIPPLSVPGLTVLVAVPIKPAETLQGGGLFAGEALQLIREPVPILGPELHAKTGSCDRCVVVLAVHQG